MVKQSELEIMVCDLFVDAYRAGASGGDGNYGVARVSRARLIDALTDLYDDIEKVKRNHNRDISDLKQELEDEKHAYSYLLTRYEELKVNQENPHELDDPLPFWDLDHEPLADAGEVEGSEE